MQFPRNHAEPTPGFASAGRLDPGIEREQLRALGHLRDNIDLRRNRLRRRIGQVFQPHDRIGQACPDVLDIGNERGDGGIPAFSIRLRARSATAIACSASALSDSSERSIVCRSFLRRVLVQRTAGPTHQDAESKKFGSSDFTRCGIAGVPSATPPTLALKPQSKKKTENARNPGAKAPGFRKREIRSFSLSSLRGIVRSANSVRRFPCLVRHLLPNVRSSCSRAASLATRPSLLTCSHHTKPKFEGQCQIRVVHTSSTRNSLYS